MSAQPAWLGKKFLHGGEPGGLEGLVGGPGVGERGFGFLFAAGVEPSGAGDFGAVFIVAQGGGAERQVFCGGVVSGELFQDFEFELLRGFAPADEARSAQAGVVGEAEGDGAGGGVFGRVAAGLLDEVVEMQGERNFRFSIFDFGFNGRERVNRWRGVFNTKARRLQGTKN